MNKSFLLLLTTFATLALIAGCIESCSTSTDTPAEAVADTTGGPLEYSDLPLFELTGNARECLTTTFYRVDVQPDGVVTPDSAGGFRTVALAFDARKHYLKKDGEKITRDTLGRIVRWEDHTSVADGLHTGFMRDTLNYNYASPNVIISRGMGEWTTTTRDSVGNIIAQVTTPIDGGNMTAATNVVLDTDDRGNWTRRLTVWNVQTPNAAPRVMYTLDTRQISYY